MHYRVRSLALTASCAAVGLMAGCGDDSSGDGSSSARAIGVAEYRSQAQPLCSKASAAMAGTEMPHSFPAQLPEYDKGSKAMLAAIQQPFKALAALAPPEGLEEPHERFAAELSSAVASARKLRELVAAGNDDTDALALARTSVATHAATAMTEADSLGLDDCTTLEFKAGGH